MSDPKSRLSTRVEVFTRATADALNRAIGEVLDARSPWQLLHRLSRIVFLGLVLYLGWILVVVQPDLAKRLMLPPTPRFQERYALHRDEVQRLLQAAVAAAAFGLHALMVAEWDGASSLQVLAVEGRTVPQPLQSGEEALLGVAMAEVMGHVALGLCESERPAALSIEEAQLPAGATLLVCPIGCAVSSTGQGVLVAIFAPATAATPATPAMASGAATGAIAATATATAAGQPSRQALPPARGSRPAGVEDSAPLAPAVSRAAGEQEEPQLRRKREQLMVLARRLAGVMQ